MYHPRCHRQYTAVKRPKYEEEPKAKKPRIKTRKSSDLPETDKQGLLKGRCVFCGKQRKKKKGKEEPLFSMATTGGCDTLVQHAHRSTNDHFKSLIMGGINLIAKEAKCHKSCRVLFMHEAEMPGPNTCTPHNFHKKAFRVLSTFIDEEVIQNNKALLVSSLLDKYKVEYASSGGDPQDLASYTSQNLIRKIQDKFADKVHIKLADQRRGNFIFFYFTH